MAILEPSLLPGLEDAVLLGGLKEMQILQTKTSWMIIHGPGMEFPLEPNLPKFQFTSNGLDKRARTDYLSMYDYMTRVYVPKPSDMHPKPHARVGASQYRSMFDYMLTEHRARVKRRSRRVYEKPSVIYKRGLPSGKDNPKSRGIQSSDGNGKVVENHEGKMKEIKVQQQEDEIGDMPMRKSEVLSRNIQAVGNFMEDSRVKIPEDEGGDVTLRKSQVLFSNQCEGIENSTEDSKVAEDWFEKLNDGVETSTQDSKVEEDWFEKQELTESEVTSTNSLEIGQLEEDTSVIATEMRLLDETVTAIQEDQRTSP